MGDQAIRSQNFALFVADLLEDYPQWFESGISEFNLIARLQNAPYQLFDKDALREPLTLFQTHFVLFHALYHLQARWASQGIGVLDIHTLRVLLRPLSDATAALPGRADPMREYYLNWRNFDNTGKEDVDALLDDFWQRMGGHVSDVSLSASEVKDARQTLHLDPSETLSLKQVKRQYRSLIHQHHPDKGGDEATAKRLVKAYSVLTAYVRQTQTEEV